MSSQELAFNYEEEKEILKGDKSRSWFLTINEKAFNDDVSYENMRNYLDKVFANLKYACWNEEKGDNGNIHMHLYMELGSPVSFGSVKKKFPGANIQKRKGNPTESRRYILKPEGVLFSGKEKSHTKTKDFQEMGDFTEFEKIKARGEISEKKKVNERIDEMLSVCKTWDECVVHDSALANQYQKVILSRLDLNNINNFKKEHCTVMKADNGKEVVKVKRRVYYLWGNSGAGKTTGIKMKFGDDEVSEITSFRDNMKFDDYKENGVMIWDEFYGQLPLQECLNLLDGSGIGTLPCRFHNKPNLSHTIIMTSNDSFDKLYKNVKENSSEKYKAFVRRVNCGVWRMYQTSQGKRYIACQTDINKIEERLRPLYDLSVPPISLQGVELVSYEELIKIIDCDIPF